MKRRDFLFRPGGNLGIAGCWPNQSSTKNGFSVQDHSQGGEPRNVIICAANGYNYIDAGFEKLRGGADTLDAAIAVVSGPENDPNDDSVGLGGLPNEEGVVELDSCCMHGPTRRAGAVGAVRDIKNVASVAKAVMEHTGHVMLVGEGATRFAIAMGFPKEFVDRAFAQNLDVVEGNAFQSGLVGAGNFRSQLEASRSFVRRSGRSAAAHQKNVCDRCRSWHPRAAAHGRHP